MMFCEIYDSRCSQSGNGKENAILTCIIGLSGTDYTC